MSERIDMSEFEAQFETNEKRFSPLMSNGDFERLAFLNIRIDDITGERELLKEDNARLEISRQSINAMLAEIRRIEQQLLNRRRPIDEGIAKNDRIGRYNRDKKEAYERERARLLEEIEARERFIAQRKAMDKATNEFPWRVGVDGKKALPHQLDGAYRLVSAKRAILGDKPGLGKTLQAIMTIDLLRATGTGKKVLIFTPKSVLMDFERAFKRWTNPTFVHVLNQTLKGVKSDILEALSHMDELIVITNYEVWRKDASIKQKLIDCGFDTIILDEAHVLKDNKSVTTQGIREIVYAENRCPKCGFTKIVNRGMAKLCAACEYEQEEFGDFCSIKNVYPMTGTPILNKPQELWSLLNMVDRTGFPKESNFLTDYCFKDYDYVNNRSFWTFGNGGSDRLLKKLGMKYTARDRDSAGVKMPPQEIRHHNLELDPEKYPNQARFIELLRERARLAFSDDHQMTMDATLNWYTRMRQAASWPDAIKIKGCPHEPICLNDEGDPGNCIAPVVIFPPPDAPPIGESVIMDECESIINEAVESGDRIIVFSMFKPVLAELERRCTEAGLRHAKIIGSVKGEIRQEYIDDFNTNHTKVGEHKYDVLLCQYATADTGLNLNGAQQVLCVERQWNPGKEEQAMDRVRRIDSDTDSIVHLIHCEGTATDLIDGIMEHKKSMLEGFEADVNLAERMRKFLEG